MLLYTLGFLAIAVLAAILGLHGVASGAAGLAGLTFVLFFFTAVGMLLWQIFAPPRSTPHV